MVVCENSEMEVFVEVVGAWLVFCGLCWVYSWVMHDEDTPMPDSKRMWLLWGVGGGAGVPGDVRGYRVDVRPGRRRGV